MAEPLEIHESRSRQRTVEIGRQFAGRLGAGDCVALSGQLGAGKTQFTRGLACGLGLEDERMVSSPTFVLMQEYPGRVPVYHLDAYRLTDAAAELRELGFEEMLANGVVVLEWAERAPEVLPRGSWLVEISITGRNRRRIAISRLP